MSEKRIVILNNRLMRKIDEHRGQLSRVEFVDECVEKLLNELSMELKRMPTGGKVQDREAGPAYPAEYVTKHDFDRFKRNIDNLQQQYMDFFMKYGKQLAGESLSGEEERRFYEELRRLLQL